MPHKPRPRAPSYLTFDRTRQAWQLRFRYVDTLGAVHWPRERSPWPQDYQRSARWAPGRREAIIAELEAELRRLDPDPPITLGQVLDAYQADCVERGTRWEGERARAGILRASLGADFPAEGLTVAAATEWRARIRTERHLSARSLNAYTTLLVAALNLAVRQGRLAENPLRHLRRLPAATRQPPALSERQVGALLAACRVWERWEHLPQPDPRRRRLPIATRILLGYYTGARPEAVDGLRWGQVDFRRGLLRYDSKGHRAIVCPIEPYLLGHLAELSARIHAAPEHLVLEAPRSGRRAVNWRRPWARVLAIANRRLPPAEQIPAAAPLHVLRHSRISHLLGAGVPAQVVAQITGTSLVMLQRHYAHLMMATLEAELGRARRHPVLRAVESFAHGQTPEAKAAEKPPRRAPGQSDNPQDGHLVH